MNISALLPFLFLLACPLMMIFMMRGMHGGHDGGHGNQNGTGNDAQTRIAELEREVADLRGTPAPVRLDKPASKS